MGEQIKTTIFVAVSVDVEEEGLFSGRYLREPVGVSNVAEIKRLRFVSSEFSIPLTLLADYPVLLSPLCHRHLSDLLENFGAEIGTHLHHWNTPPFDDLDHVQPVLTQNMDSEVLRRKMEVLKEAAGTEYGIIPTTFRMGRFDLSPNVRSFLGDLGYTVDSSVVPFRFCPGTADHLFSRADPYLLTHGEKKILEVPVTMVAINCMLSRAAIQVSRCLPRKALRPALGVFRRLAVCGPHPAWFSLTSMKHSARLHINRGGRVLNIFLHSSEIAPGMSPASINLQKTDAILSRLQAFLVWLSDRYEVRGITLAELSDIVRPWLIKSD